VKLYVKEARLCSFRFSFSFDILEVLERHTEVVPSVYFEMARSTEGNLFTVYSSHHFTPQLRSPKKETHFFRYVFFTLGSPPAHFKYILSL